MAIEAPKTQRDQLLAIGAFLAIAAIVGFYMYVWSPKSEELVKTQTRIDTLVAQNELARREVARGTASKLKEEAEQYGRMLAVMRTLVPTANEVPVLLDDISTAARRAGLELGGTAPLGVISGDIFDTHKYKLQVTGPYHKVAQFLTNIASMTRIVAPINVTLVGAAANARKSTAGEQMLDVQFEIQTYVAKGGVRGQ
ncbi:MAG TPA: type 4a pilus biogenesis protein PilO [Gemmatimonadaceae bacterium]